VICDEITAPLDVSVQAQIIELLPVAAGRRPEPPSLITHDLNLIPSDRHRIAVMRRGEVVDLLPVEDSMQTTFIPTPRTDGCFPRTGRLTTGFPSMDHNAKALLARIDVPAALDLLSRMVQHKSYSKSDGESSSQPSWLAACASSAWRPSSRPSAMRAGSTPSPLEGQRRRQEPMFNGHLDTNR